MASRPHQPKASKPDNVEAAEAVTAPQQATPAAANKSTNPTQKRVTRSAGTALAATGDTHASSPLTADEAEKAGTGSDTSGLDVLDSDEFSDNDRGVVKTQEQVIDHAIAVEGVQKEISKPKTKTSTNSKQKQKKKEDDEEPDSVHINGKPIEKTRDPWGPEAKRLHKILHTQASGDVPKFSRRDPEWQSKGTLQYPDNAADHQNALNVSDADFEHLRIPGDIRGEPRYTVSPVSKADQMDDFKRMGLRPDDVGSDASDDSDNDDFELDEVVEQTTSQTSAPEDDLKAQATSSGEATTGDNTLSDTVPVTPTPTEKSKKRAAHADPQSNAKRVKLSAPDALRADGNKRTKRPADEELASTNKRVKTESDEDSADSARSGIVLKLGKNVRDTNATPAKQQLKSNTAASTRTRRQANLTTPSKAAAVAATPSNQDGDEIEIDTPSAKREIVPTIPSDYKSEPSGHGYALQIPPSGSRLHLWQCGRPSCASGMTWLPRDKLILADGKSVAGTGRKGLSDIFGRNKTSTRQIPSGVWNWICRKHYQTEKYTNTLSKDRFPRLALNLARLDDTRKQLRRIELYRPHAVFKVQLNSAAEKRIVEFNAALRGHNNDKAATVASLSQPVAKPNADKCFPVLLLDEFKATFARDDQTYANIATMLTWLETHLNDGSTTWYCPMELLINKRPAGEYKTSSKLNYQLWEADLAGKVFDEDTAYEPGNDATGEDSDTYPVVKKGKGSDADDDTSEDES